MKFSSKNLGLDGRDLCSIFTQSVTIVGWVLSPRLMSPGLGCLVGDEMMYGCIEPNRFLFVEGP